MAAGGERAAAAALQTYSPAGGGYLSHLVHSSGWPIPSTTTAAAATHGEHSACVQLSGNTHWLSHRKQPLMESVRKSENWQHLNVNTDKIVLKQDIAELEIGIGQSQV